MPERHIYTLKEPFSIFPLGDSAITLDLGNYIDEQLNIKAIAIQNWLISNHFPGILDIIVAYSSVSVFYDPIRVRKEDAACENGAFACVRQWLGQAWQAVGQEENGNGLPMDHGTSGIPGNIIRIPVCYEEQYAPDLVSFSLEKGMTREEVIGLHTSTTYRVYMIGFLPGFPYLGKVDQRLHAPRKPSPVPVKAGGVGVAGNQTGIYTLNSPGGWHIIGRTPVRLFTPETDPPVRLTIGDSVIFFPVTGEEFRDWENRHP